MKVRITQSPENVNAPGAYWAGSVSSGFGEIVVDFEGIEHEPDLSDQDKRFNLYHCCLHEVGHALQEFFGLELSDPLGDGMCGGDDPEKACMVIVPLEEHEEIVAEKDAEIQRLRSELAKLNALEERKQQ